MKQRFRWPPKRNRTVKQN